MQARALCQARTSHLGGDKCSRAIRAESSGELSEWHTQYADSPDSALSQSRLLSGVGRTLSFGLGVPNCEGVESVRRCLPSAPFAEQERRVRATTAGQGLEGTTLRRGGVGAACGQARWLFHVEFNAGSRLLGGVVRVVGGRMLSVRVACRAMAFAAAVILCFASGAACAWDEAPRACPVCHASQDAPLDGACTLVSGVDIDLCVHDAYESRYVTQLCWCRGCGYVAPRPSFTDPLGPAELSAVREVLGRRTRAADVGADADATVRGVLAEQRIRLDLALEICRMRGSGVQTRWTMLRDAAWAERCEGSRLIAESLRSGPLAVAWERCEQDGLGTAAALHMARPESGDPPAALLNVLEHRVEENASESSNLRHVRRLFAAWVARRQGENTTALRLLSMIGADESSEVLVYRRALEESIRAERSWQRQLADMSSAVIPASAVRWAGTPEFQCAEALRRLDRRAEALPHYIASVERGLPLAQIEWVRRQLDGSSTKWAESIDRAIGDEVASMMSTLQGNRGLDFEHEGSWRARPDLLIPPLLVRLRQSEDGNERISVVRRLRDLVPMSADVAVALARSATQDTSQGVRAMAVRAIARGPADVVRLPLELLLSSDDPDVREQAASALGGAGDEHSVSLLLDAGDGIRDAVVARAVGQIANRHFDGREECALWWGSVGSQSRRADWVVDGFRRLGLNWPEQDAAGSDAWQFRAIELLDDDRPFVRANALRLLRDSAGVCDPWPDVGRGQVAAGNVWHAIRRAWGAYVVRWRWL